MPWDLELSRWIRSLHIPGDLHKFLQLTESIAHFLTCCWLFACLAWVDIGKRRILGIGWCFVLFGGGIANLFKGVIPRVRPHALEKMPLALQPQNNLDIWGTPFSGSWFDESNRSFPSGHSATAISVAIALSIIYPRGKWFIFPLAICACFQRVECGAHYVSDVFLGISIALICSQFFWPRMFAQPSLLAHEKSTA